MGRAVSRIARGDSDSMTSGYSKSAPTQDGTNRFLQLPGEIRNTIYEYALTANHHELFYRDSIDFDSIPQGVTEEVNSVDNIWHATPQECVDAYYEHESAQDVKLCSTAESTSEFNQLKYVCKQLHKETNTCHCYTTISCSPKTTCALKTPLISSSASCASATSLGLLKLKLWKFDHPFAPNMMEWMSQASS